MLKSVFGVFFSLSISVLPVAAMADVITHFGNAVGPDLGGHLDALGIGASNTASESTAKSFLVPGTAADTYELKFSFRQDAGTFFFDFGFFELANVTANPLTDRQSFITQALSGATLVFHDLTDDPGVDVTKSLPGGSHIGFFIVPNNTLENFNSNPAPYFNFVPKDFFDYDPYTPPIFSESNANLGNFDQFLAFFANDRTLFAWEDFNARGFTNNSFNDLVFSIDAQLIPVPEPSTIALALLSVPALFALRRRLR